MKYRICFEECHGYHEGDVVEERFLGGDVKYLLTIGAIEAVDDAKKPAKDAKKDGE